MNIATAEDRAEYEQEIDTMAQLNDQPHALHLLSSKAFANTWGYILLPLVPHPDLLAYVKAALFLGWKENRIWDSFGKAAALQMSTAVADLHAKGKGHGDLKLDNILVSEVAAGSGGTHTFTEASCQELVQTSERWLTRDCPRSKMFQQAIVDLVNDNVPTSFLLFDFGKSAPLLERPTNEPRNMLNVHAIDAHMWTMSLLQLRHATNGLYRQMKTLNGRHFSGDIDLEAFANVLRTIDQIDVMELDGHLKGLATGTEADETFAHILNDIRTPDSRQSRGAPDSDLQGAVNECSKVPKVTLAYCCHNACRGVNAANCEQMCTSR